MSKYWGGRSGPWVSWGALDSIWTIGGWPFAARLVVNEQEGVLLNVASPMFGSVVIGVYPDHKRPGCVTGIGVVRGVDDPGIEPHHYCWASKIPVFELGPDPSDLRDAGVRRHAKLYEMVGI